MEESNFYEPDNHTASQGILCTLLKQKVHYHVHNGLILNPILHQLSSVNVQQNSLHRQQAFYNMQVF